MRAVIVASGPSARDFNPPDDITVIAVNGAIDWLPRADYWFSLDASPENIRRYRKRRLPNCCYMVAGERWRPIVSNLVALYRRIDSLGTYPEPTVKGSPQWWLWRLGAVLGINTTPGCINTGNSAWGAVGLAYHLGFRDVALVGVDANDEPRVEGGQSKTLCHLPLLFASALPEVRVTSCGAMRGGFPSMPFDEWYDHG